MLFGPVSRLTERELEAMLDMALASDDMPTVWEIVREFDRRGEIIEV